MRAVITFEVHGRNHTELADNTLMKYREYVGNNSASLPPNTHLEVTQHLASGDGKILGWVAEATISVNNSTFE